MLNKILKYKSSIAILFIVSFIFVSVNFVYAAESLIVIFNPNPLFDEVNFIPGKSVTSFVEVGNHSGSEKSIITEAINANDPGSLGDALNLEIKEDEISLFNGTLTSFFNQGELFLSNLGNSSTTTYNFIVTFDEGAGDEYQGKALNNFDILIGFQGEDDNQQIGNGGGGVRGLTIPSESDVEVATTSATISWSTSYAATSQVVYSSSEELHTFDINGVNYGYAHAFPDPEDNTKVTFHSVTIAGLDSGVTYFYRTISHASPATISRELSFNTLLAVDNSPNQPTEQSLNVTGSQDELIVEQPGQKISTKEDLQEKEYRPYIWLVIILIIIILIIIIFRRNSKQQPPSNLGQ